MKILVTGAGGYIASYLIPLLQSAGHSLRLFVNGDLSNSETRVLPSGEIGLVNGDLRDAQLCQESTKGIEAVIHLGAIVGSYDERKNMEINYRGTLNLLRACDFHHVPRFIFISSVSATRVSQGPYGRSKKLAEEAVRQSELDFTIFRPTTVMGRESPGLHRLITNINRFPFIIPLVNTGKYTRHPVYVRDFVGLIAASMSNAHSFNKTYEVGGAEVISFKRLVALINQKLGNRRKILIPVPVLVFRLAALVFERLFKMPPFTSEHVNSLTEDTRMDTRLVREDLLFNPLTLERMLEIVIAEIKAMPINQKLS